MYVATESNFISRRSRHRGFNFVEVLFAVIILGLGFIMIAGIFPVALQQSGATANETLGALTARDAVRTIQSLAESGGAVSGTLTANNLFAQNASFIPFNATIQTLIGNSAYNSSDRRFAWLGFYRRPNATDPFMQIVVISLMNTNFADVGYPTDTTKYPAYSFPPILPTGVPFPPPTPPTGQAAFTVAPPAMPMFPVPAAQSPIDAELAYSSLSGTSYIFLNNHNMSSGDPVTNAVTGAYVLIASDPGNASPVVSGTQLRPADAMTGRLLRLGDQLDSTNPNLPGDVSVPPLASAPYSYTLNFDIFQLAPGNDLKDISEQTVSAPTPANQHVSVYIIGRAPIVDPTSLPEQANFTGPNQDIAAMSSFVRINTSN